MYSIIKEKIEKQEWPNGSQIPTEDELCRTYDVSKATVRNAVSELVRSGYLKKQQGKGTFVTYGKQDLGVTMKTKLTEDMFGEGVKAKKEVLEKGLKEPSEEMRSILRVNGERTGPLLYPLQARRERRDGLSGRVLCPASVFPGIEDEDVCRMPFYDLIQEKGARKILKVVQTIEVSEARGEARVAAQDPRRRAGAPAPPAADRLRLKPHRLYPASRHRQEIQDHDGVRTNAK